MADLQGRMIGAMQADVKTLAEIEADSTALGQAVTVIVIAGVASLIGNFYRHGHRGLCRACIGPRQQHGMGRFAGRRRAC